MKKILLSLAMIALVSSVAFGATKAYFTSDATQTGETFATGTLRLNINADDTYQNGIRTTVPFHFDNLKPGDTMRQWITLHNAGTLDIGHLTIQAANPSDSSGLLGQVLVSVIGFDNNPPFANNAYFTPGWGAGGSAISPWMTAAKDILSTSAVIWSPGPTSTVIPAGQDDLIVLDFTVPSGMGNTYQGVSASFDLVFHAEQVY